MATPTISCQIGTVVDYRSHPRAEPRRTKTTSEPWILGGHTRVVMVAGVSGCVALDALTIVPPSVETTKPALTVKRAKKTARRKGK